MKIDHLYDNTTHSERVYLKIYEGDNRFPIIYWIEIFLDECQGNGINNVSAEVRSAEPDAYMIWNAETKSCEWSGEYTDSDNDGIPDEAPVKDTAESEDDNMMLYVGAGVALIIIVLLSLFFVLGGGKEDDIVDSGMIGDFGATAAGYGGVAQMDPMEQYVQQLIAQGYPEETARAYAQQYAGHFQQQQ